MASACYPALRKPLLKRLYASLGALGVFSGYNILGLVCTELFQIPGEIAPRQTKKLNRHKQLVES